MLAELNFSPLAVQPPLLNAVLNMIIGALIASFLHNRVPAPEGETDSVPGLAESNAAG